MSCTTCWIGPPADCLGTLLGRFPVGCVLPPSFFLLKAVLLGGHKAELPPQAENLGKILHLALEYPLE